MSRAMSLACVPWLSCLAISLLALVVLWRAIAGRPHIARLRRLPADERGSAQSLSFVLALPLLVMIVLFIVQVSQLMIGVVVVHYAAYAAARAAAVWIPADLAHEDPREGANCISAYAPDPAAKDQVPPSIGGPSDGGITFYIEPAGPKFNKIASAAIIGCVPICPSRDVGMGVSASPVADSIASAYYSLAGGASANSVLPKRIDNNLAYAIANTIVEMRFFHPNSEPPLSWHWGGPYGIPADAAEFQANELGWQDQITVTVNHHFALLPGVGRLLAAVLARAAPDRSTYVPNTTNGEHLYTYRLDASATIGNEGNKSVAPYVYQTY